MNYNIKYLKNRIQKSQKRFEKLMENNPDIDPLIKFIIEGVIKEKKTNLMSLEKFEEIERSKEKGLL